MNPIAQTVAGDEGSDGLRADDVELNDLLAEWERSLPARLEELHEQWERSGCNDVPTLHVALQMIGGKMPLPMWLAMGLSRVLMGQLRILNLLPQDEKRWLLVQHLHFDLGLTFNEAYKGAAKELGGSPQTMKKAYQNYEKYLREKSPKQCATAAARAVGSPHPGFVDVDIGYCHVRRDDVPKLLRRCPGLVEFGRRDGFVRLAVDNPGGRSPKAGETLELMRQCPGLVEVASYGGDSAQFKLA